MDWSRAKNILIFIFIILNIFLLIYGGTYRSQNNNSSEAVTAILSILDKKSIKIKQGYELPAYDKKMPMLIMESYHLNRNEILRFLLGENEDFDLLEEISKSVDIDKAKTYVVDNKNIKFTGSGSFVYIDLDSTVKIDGFDFNKNKLQDRQILKSFRQFFSNMDIDVSSFALDGIIAHENNSYTLTFIDIYNDYPVFDNKIKITVSNGGLRSLDFCANEIKGFSKSSSPIMPAHLVLLKNFYTQDNSEKENSNVIIESVDIGFKGFDSNNDGDGNNAESTVQSPSWRIRTEDGREIYFKAYDGEEIK